MQSRAGKWGQLARKKVGTRKICRRSRTRPELWNRDSVSRSVGGVGFYLAHYLCADTPRSTFRNSLCLRAYRRGHAGRRLELLLLAAGNARTQMEVSQWDRSGALVRLPEQLSLRTISQCDEQLSVANFGRRHINHGGACRCPGSQKR